MKENSDLRAYLSKGIEDSMRDLVRATPVNPRESAFMLKFAAATAAASSSSRRRQTRSASRCWSGNFTAEFKGIHKGRPYAEDLTAAAAFAKALIA